VRARFESVPISFRYKLLALYETKSGIHPLSWRLAGSKYKQNLDSVIWSKQKLSKESERWEPSNNGLYPSYMLKPNPVG